MLSREQLELRQTGLGGSDMGAVCGEDRFRRPIDVYRAKTEPIVITEPTEAQRWGNIHEQSIADDYARRHKRVVLGPFGTRRVPSRPWHLYSLDRVALKPKSDRIELPTELPHADDVDHILEIKTAGANGARYYGASGTDDVPFSVIIQCQWYMAATSISECVVAALLNGNDPRYYPIGRDPGLEGILLQRAEEFWQRVKERRPPDPDRSEQFTTYLRQRYHKTSGEIVDANPDQADVMRRLRDVRLACDELKMRKEHLEQKLMIAIGDADGIESEHGVVSFRFDSRGRVNYRKVCDELCETHQIGLRDRERLFDKHRGRAPRKLLTPRTWAYNVSDSEDSNGAKN